MFATLLLALIAQAPIERPAVPVRVALVDPKGNDVTKEASAPGSKLEVKLLRWVGTNPDVYAGKGELGVAIPVVPPTESAWSVGLGAPLLDVQPHNNSGRGLAPGWAYVGDPCPGIEIAAKASGEQVLPVLVARTRTVELTYELPEGCTARPDFRADGLILPEAGYETHFDFTELALPPRVLSSTRVELPPGRHTAWGTARYSDLASSSGMSTREDFVVTDAEVQRVVLRYRTAIVFTGRMVDPSGKRVMSGSVLLTVPDTRRFTGRCPQSIGTTVWAAHFDPQGRFDIRGVPPGIEVVVPGWWMHGPARFRIPEKSGDVGEIRLEY